MALFDKQSGLEYFDLRKTHIIQIDKGNASEGVAAILGFRGETEMIPQPPSPNRKSVVVRWHVCMCVCVCVCV